LKFDIYNIKLLFSRKIHILSDYNIYLSNLFCSASLLTLFTFCFEFSNEQQQPYKCTTEACECMKQNLVCASVKILLCRFCFCFLFFFTTNNASYDGFFSTFTIHLCNSFASIWQSMEKKIFCFGSLTCIRKIQLAAKFPMDCHDRHVYRVFQIIAESQFNVSFADTNYRLSNN